MTLRRSRPPLGDMARVLWSVAGHGLAAARQGSRDDALFGLAFVEELVAADGPARPLSFTRAARSSAEAMRARLGLPPAPPEPPLAA